MHPNANPFNPGAGSPPHTLAGRDAEVTAITTAIERSELQRGANGIVLHGLRGTGKTVLLGRFCEIASDRGWIAVRVEAAASTSATFAEQLVTRLTPHMLRLDRPSAGERVKRALGAFKSFSLSVGLQDVSAGIEVDPRHLLSYGTSIEHSLPDMLRTLAEACAETRTGVLIAVDEMHDLSRADLRALLAVGQEANESRAPLLLCGAGLPALPRLLSEARTYAERFFEFRAITWLDKADARRALVAPVEALGESWTQDGLEVILSSAGGYPYFLQHFGRAAWNVAAYSPISANDAVAARRLGFAELDQGFFHIRWERATGAERSYLRAMAVDGDGPSRSGDVAQRLGKPASALSAIRTRLIDKGIVYAPARGRIGFTVPGMATYIRRRDEQE
ncbi:AAA family ATPase [Demequina sp. NBRC 110053]|uniref:AAA family ATPase n=1 Tax=Demequina sp. NBRC 110053 TaxID=1570342 RepID=UPI0013566DFC|nr:AAA family ATPase [Demequina sp. NBRC 110053]